MPPVVQPLKKGRIYFVTKTILLELYFLNSLHSRTHGPVITSDKLLQIQSRSWRTSSKQAFYFMKITTHDRILLVDPPTERNGSPKICKRCVRSYNFTQLQYGFINYYYFITIYFNCRWDFTRWQWYYNKTQYKNNTHHQNNTLRSIFQFM
jgi:hypothetical protein